MGAQSLRNICGATVWAYVESLSTQMGSPCLPQGAGSRDLSALRAPWSHCDCCPRLASGSPAGAAVKGVGGPASVTGELASRRALLLSLGWGPAPQAGPCACSLEWLQSSIFSGGLQTSQTHYSYNEEKDEDHCSSPGGTPASKSRLCAHSRALGDHSQAFLQALADNSIQDHNVKVRRPRGCLCRSGHPEASTACSSIGFPGLADGFLGGRVEVRGSEGLGGVGSTCPRGCGSLAGGHAWGRPRG